MIGKFKMMGTLLLAGLVLAAAQPASAALSSSQIEKAIGYGQAKVGKSRYTGCSAGNWRMGGTTTYERHFDGYGCGQKVYVLRPGWYGFDCSGLIHMMYRAAGVTAPTSSSGFASAGVGVSKANIKRGDLLVYAGHHVAMYLGRTSDGVPWALEASPNIILEQAVASDGKVWRVADGVMAVNAQKYLNSGNYVVRRL